MKRRRGWPTHGAVKAGWSCRIVSPGTRVRCRWSATNALGGVTAITNAIVSNRLCVTNTYPDGGTRVETYYRDGRMEKVFGTAVQNPTHYTYAIEQDGTNGPWREFSLETKTDAAGGDTSERTKIYRDAAGGSY